MKWKKGLCIGVMCCALPLAAGCSFTDTLGVLFDQSADDAEAEEAAPTLEAAIVDDSVEKPTITSEMGDPVTYNLNATPDPITVTAQVSDGGTLSYQWYRNNTDSNGGGTEIEGETGDSYTPPTDTPGTTYYFAVVTNTLDGKIQLATTGTKCVTVTETEQTLTADSPSADGKGTWKNDGTGWTFVYADGTNAVGKWEEIDGQTYVFDGNGYMVVGWYQEGENRYYFNENGAMAKDVDVDGYHIGSDGIATPIEQTTDGSADTGDQTATDQTADTAADGGEAAQ